jgi:hypothetical protein
VVLTRVAEVSHLDRDVDQSENERVPELDIPSLVFIAVLGVVALAVVRGIWGPFWGVRELDTSTSWGRQLFGRRKKS